MDEDDTDEGRSTAPQSDFGMREVGIGVGVFVVGAAVAFGVPIALSL